MTRRSATLHVVQLAVITVAAFLVGLSYLAYATFALGRHTTSLVTNALPSAEALSSARTTIRQLDTAMDRALLERMEGRPFDPAAIGQQRKELQEWLHTYAALPMYPRERERYLDVVADLDRLDGALAECLALIDEQNLARAHECWNGVWRAASDRMDQSVRSLMMFNIGHLRNHAQEIDRIWRFSLAATAGVGLLTILLSSFSTVMAIRAIRRHERFQEERAYELEMFAGRVAHDLMSPLASVGIALQVAEENSGDARIVRLSSRALSSLRRLQATVNALLEFARAGGRATPGRASVRQIVPPLVEELTPVADQASVTLSSGRLPSVEVACPPGILSTVLSNLLQNAIKHMGDSPIRQVALHVTSDAERARFEVHDTGPGVPAEVRERIFDPFVRSAATGVPGIGLGLATVKRLTEAYGGTVGVCPGDERGAIFWFELPTAALEPERPLPPPPAIPTTLHTTPLA